MALPRTSVALALTLAACTGELGSMHGEDYTGRVPHDPDGPPGGGPPRETGYTLLVDTSDTEAYAGETATTWPIRGRVTASEGVGTVTVSGHATPAASDGRFTSNAALTPGVNLVEITGTDRASPAHMRKGHRVVLATNYLAEGALNTRAAALTLTDAIVGPMAAPLAGRVASIDIAGEIMRRPTLTSDECTTRPRGARHGTPTLGLRVTPEGTLRLEVVIPGLRVDFDGTCSSFLGTQNVSGNMTTDVVIATNLGAAPSDDCVIGLDHTPAVVEMRGFDMDVSGGSGLLEGLIIGLVAEMREGDTADSLRAEFAAQAEALLGPELAGITVFESASTMTLFETPIDVALCMTGLVSEGGTLRAYVGATAMGPGGREDAPGAPAVRGELPPSVPGSMWLDANLVGQLVFSAWRAGALSQENVQQIDMATLAIVAPQLRTMFPAGTKADVSIEGNLAPLVRGAPAAADGTPTGDLLLEIGDLQLVLSVDGEELFRIGTLLRLTLDLTPVDGGLAPTVANVDATAWVIDEPIVDANDEVLEAAVGLQIGDAASALLGDAVIALPEIGGAPLRASDAVATADGRYVRLTLM